MFPVYRRDFKILAELRSEEVLILLAKGKQQGAYYLAGYAVECAQSVHRQEDVCP
jgi:hypothetical protein